MKKYLYYTFLMGFVLACYSVPEPMSELVYVSSFRSEAARKAQEGCSFRYRIENSFDRLNDLLQQESIRSAFTLWQNANPNIQFLQFQTSREIEINIRFVGREVIGRDSVQLTTPISLIGGNLRTLTAAKREKNHYTILLASDYLWDGPSLTRAVAHHIGLFLGMSTNDQVASIMNPLLLTGVNRLAKGDSTLICELYAKPCFDLQCTYLPTALSVNKETKRTVCVDRNSTLQISARGSINVGFYVGGSSPRGVERGIFNFPIDEYNIVKGINHAALIYRLNDDPTWRLCGEGCEIQLDGKSQYQELTFHINDNDLLNNSGAYEVHIDYKK